MRTPIFSLLPHDLLQKEVEVLKLHMQPHRNEVLGHILCFTFYLSPNWVTTVDPSTLKCDQSVLQRFEQLFTVIILSCFVLLFLLHYNISLQYSVCPLLSIGQYFHTLPNAVSSKIKAVVQLKCLHPEIPNNTSLRYECLSISVLRTE